MAQVGNFGGPIFMLGFGLATMPALLLVGIFSNYLKAFLNSHRKNLLPLWLLIMGIIFLLRGLNLGIPYFSPKMDAVRMKGGHCCDK
jgi:sulfite exporter TauE/SafE